MRELHRGFVAALAAAGVVVVTGGLQAQQGTADRSGYPAGDWPLAGGNWYGSRYSTLADVTRDTVARLGGAWVAQLPGGAASRATPVVEDGVLYLPGGANVFALDARTGETLWRWQPPPERPEMTPSWQGVGLGAGLVFVGLGSAEVAALRRESGELAWVTPVGSVPRGEGERVTTAPMYARGLVFVGVANGDSGGQGRIVALDAASGEVRWTFFVVPRPGEFGHDTWPQDNESWRLGGGGVWLVGTVDPDLGLVYFSTGNAVPMFGGELRAGDNLFTASVLALDMDSGERRWHYQVVRHDVWDADIATPLLLYEAQAAGGPRPALAAMRADGYLFPFDRATGEPLVPLEERPVPQDAFLHTAPTQPYPAGARSILPDCSFWRDRVPPPFELSCSPFTPPSVQRQDVVAPGAPMPRVRVTPMAFSPQTGYVYAQGLAHVGRTRRFADPWLAFPLDDHISLPRPVGILAAIDPRSSRVVWEQEVPGPLLGTSGPLVTAGGLMFRASPGGWFEAYDARGGERVWAFRTAAAGARLRPGPAAAYALDGRQYIAVPMGRELWAFTLDGAVAARGEAPADAGAELAPPGPAPRETGVVEAATLLVNPAWAVGGRRYVLDEHTFNPVRARVSAGARLQFRNNGELPHTIAARDGSWTTGRLEPAAWTFVAFERPGTFRYHCTEHPWAVGEITVAP